MHLHKYTHASTIEYVSVYIMLCCHSVNEEILMKFNIVTCTSACIKL